MLINVIMFDGVWCSTASLWVYIYLEHCRLRDTLHDESMNNNYMKTINNQVKSQNFNSMCMFLDILEVYMHNQYT